MDSSKFSKNRLFIIQFFHRPIVPAFFNTLPYFTVFLFCRNLTWHITLYSSFPLFCVQTVYAPFCQLRTIHLFMFQLSVPNLGSVLFLNWDLFSGRSWTFSLAQCCEIVGINSPSAFLLYDEVHISVLRINLSCR